MLTKANLACAVEAGACFFVRTNDMKMLMLLAFGRSLPTTAADADDAGLEAWCFATSTADTHHAHVGCMSCNGKRS